MGRSYCRTTLTAVAVTFVQASWGEPAFVQAAGSPIAIEGSPGAIFSGDVNADGAIDLLITNRKAGHVGILLGDGSGKFQLNSSTIANTSGVIKVVDLNKDGKLDVASVSDRDYSIDVYLGDGAGGFTRAEGSPVRTKGGNNARPYGLEAADFNEDGHLDLVMANNIDGDVSGAFGDGTGRFTAMPKAILIGMEPFDLAVHDVNGDSRADLIAPTSEGRIAEVTVLYGDGKGGFARGTPFEGAADPYAVAVGDVNGDGHIDFATVQAEMPLVCVGLSDGKGKFSIAPGSPFNVASARHATDVEMGDANGDGRMDLYLAAGRNVQVWIADKKGGVAQAEGSPYALGSGTWRLHVADLNKDGRADLATTDYDRQSVVILLAH